MTDAFPRVSAIDGSVCAERHPFLTATVASIRSRAVDTAAAVLMNRADHLDPALNWAGCTETGRGVSRSHLGHFAMTRRKSRHLRKL